MACGRCVQDPVPSVSDQATGDATTDPGAFDGEAAYDTLKRVCELGPRISGSEAMLKQQQMLRELIEANGGVVIEQPFDALHPLTGGPVRMINLVGRWHPERKKRVLFCCHYDTRPFPDKDLQNPQGLFLGANDGASGVGLLGELSRHFAAMDGKWGVDVAFFDGEELVYVAQRDPLLIGSTWFSQVYNQRQWDVRYEFAILVDMIGDSSLQVYQEKNSLELAPRLVKSIWSVAADLGVTEFIPQQKHVIRDDHLPLNQIARIPTVDLIDFDYPDETSKNAYWHTTQDLPENCSAESLGKVGAVLLEWLRRLQQIRGS